MCDPSTGVCDCPARFTGFSCMFMTCSHNGVYYPPEDRCVCRRGWDGPDCDQCATADHGKAYVCVPVPAGGYKLLTTKTSVANRLLSGAQKLHSSTTHNAILPNSIGYDGATYDCSCEREDDDRFVSKRSKKRVVITQEQFDLFNQTVTEWAIEEMELGEDTELFLDVLGDCLEVSQSIGINTLYVLVIIFGIGFIVFLVITIIFCVSRGRVPQKYGYIDTNIGGGKMRSHSYARSERSGRSSTGGGSTNSSISSNSRKWR